MTNSPDVQVFVVVKWALCHCLVRMFEHDKTIYTSANKNSGAGNSNGAQRSFSCKTRESEVVFRANKDVLCRCVKLKKQVLVLVLASLVCHFAYDVAPDSLSRTLYTCHASNLLIRLVSTIKYSWWWSFLLFLGVCSAFFGLACLCTSPIPPLFRLWRLPNLFISRFRFQPTAATAVFEVSITHLLLVLLSVLWLFCANWILFLSSFFVVVFLSLGSSRSQMSNTCCFCKPRMPVTLTKHQPAPLLTKHQPPPHYKTPVAPTFSHRGFSRGSFTCPREFSFRLLK